MERRSQRVVTHSNRVTSSQRRLFSLTRIKTGVRRVYSINLPPTTTSTSDSASRNTASGTLIAS
jgi:hypothetical protein